MALVLFDVSNMIYRAFHALDPEKFVRSSDGLSTNSVYGVASITLSLLSKFSKEHTHIHPVACFDSPTCNAARKGLLPEYKANRQRCPEKLSHQFQWIRELFASMGIRCEEHPRMEADDIIASYCKNAQSLYDSVIIVSSDKDLCQLVGPTVHFYNTRLKAHVSHDDVVARYGVTPAQFPLYQSMVGDSCDNIVGIRGIGPKAATGIITACEGDISKLDSSHKKWKLVQDHIELIETNVKLTTLASNADLEWNVPCYQETTAEFSAFLKSMDIEKIGRRTFH